MVLPRTFCTFPTLETSQCLVLSIPLVRMHSPPTARHVALPSLPLGLDNCHLLLPHTHDTSSREAVLGLPGSTRLFLKTLREVSFPPSVPPPTPRSLHSHQPQDNSVSGCLLHRLSLTRQQPYSVSLLLFLIRIAFPTLRTQLRNICCMSEPFSDCHALFGGLFKTICLSYWEQTS